MALPAAFLRLRVCRCVPPVVRQHSLAIVLEPPPSLAAWVRASLQLLAHPMASYIGFFSKVRCPGPLAPQKVRMRTQAPPVNPPVVPWLSACVSQQKRPRATLTRVLRSRLRTDCLPSVWSSMLCACMQAPHSVWAYLRHTCHDLRLGATISGAASRSAAGPASVLWCCAGMTPTLPTVGLFAQPHLCMCTCTTCVQPHVQMCAHYTHVVHAPTFVLAHTNARSFVVHTGAFHT